MRLDLRLCLYLRRRLSILLPFRLSAFVACGIALCLLFSAGCRRRCSLGFRIIQICHKRFLSHHLGDKLDIIQILDHFICSAVTIGLILLGRFHDDLFQLRRDARHLCRHRWHRLIDVHQRDGNWVISVKRYLTGQHFVENDAQRIDVRTFVYISAARLFRRKIVYRAHDLMIAADDRGRTDCFRNTKICQLSNARIGDQNIMRLDVPVYDLIFVCQTER